MIEDAKKPAHRFMEAIASGEVNPKEWNLDLFMVGNRDNVVDKNALFQMYGGWCNANNERDSRPDKTRFFKLIRDYGESFQGRVGGKQTHVFAINHIGMDADKDKSRKDGNDKTLTRKGVKRTRAGMPVV